MRKFILVAAMVLISATAQAGASRGLTLASNDEPGAAAQPKAVDASKSRDTAKPAETPKYVDRPAALNTATPAPAADQTKHVADSNVKAPKAEKPRRQRLSIEGRIIYELHRHGIYW
jgi:hypothetical protein